MSTKLKHSSKHWDRGIRRHRTLARALHGRLFLADDGRLWLVTGKPDPIKLLPALQRLHRTPRAGTGLTPALLGFPCHADGCVTESLLAMFQQALLYWERALLKYEPQAPHDRRSTARLADERREIARLHGRLHNAYRVLRELRSGALRPGMPYVLAADEVITLAGLLTQARVASVLPPLETWLARLVMWLSGPRAAERFLVAACQLIDTTAARDKLAALASLREHLLFLRKRSETEHNGWLHVELAERLNKLPPGLLSKPGKRLSRRGTFPELCDRLIGHCDRLLDGDARVVTGYLPGALAAVAACDGALGPLPADSFRLQGEERTPANIDYLAQALIQQSNVVGYERLLEFLRHGRKTIQDTELRQVQSLLVRGVSEADIRWLAGKRNWLGTLAFSNANAGWVRHVYALLEQRRMLPDQTTGRFLTHSMLDSDLASMRQWLAWLQRLTPVTATPRIGRLLCSAMGDVIFPAIDDLKLHAEFRAWTRAASLHRAPEGAAGWLARIERLQKLAGVEPAVPQSVRKLLEQGDSLAREYAHLDELARDGRATVRQLDRHRHLTKLLPNLVVKDSKVARAAEEAFIVVALDALRTVIRRRAEAIWNEHSPWELADVPLSRLLAFAEWLQKMPVDSRKLHDELMTAWRAHGGSYKRHLAGNREWLARAAAAGVNVDRWLCAGPETIDVAGRPARVCLADDPRDIFLMGTFFRTCLSLGEFNQMSVIANAYDANKQVVYIFGERDGKRIALARLLITVSSDFHLLRYCAYTITADAATEAALVRALTDYAARRAHDAGLALADAGTPEELGTHFWYDDGEQAWPTEAQAAWQEAAESRLATVTLFVAPTWPADLIDQVPNHSHEPRHSCYAFACV